MNNFDTMFPNFATSCAALQSLLMPVAYLFLVTGMVLSTIAGRRSAEAVLRALGRTIVYIIVLTQLVNWGNQIATITNSTVTDVLHANPSNVYQQYNQALQVQKSTTNQNSWWQKLFNVGTSIFEALISGLLWIFGLLASVIVFYAYLVQKFILYLGYALSPIFIGFLAIRALNSIGTNYLLSLVGVMLWPLGWGAASLVTAGLITFMTDQSFLWNQSIGGAAGYAFQNFIGVAALGVWVIFSTIAAPIVIQRVITHGIQAGAALMSGVTTAATNRLNAVHDGRERRQRRASVAPQDQEPALPINMNDVDTTLRETPVPKTERPNLSRKKFDPTRIFVDRDRLAWFWFIVAGLILVAAAIDRVVLVQTFKQRERVVVLDPSGTFHVAPLLKFDEAKDLHAEQSTLATIAFLERNPKGFDHDDLMKQMFLKNALVKAQVERTSEQPEFAAKQLHQKAEIAKITILQTRENFVLTQVTGQLVRTGIFDDKAFAEAIPFTLAFKFQRNPNMVQNGRFPSAVYDFKYETTP